MIAITRHSAAVITAPMPIMDQMTGQKYQANVTIVLASLRHRRGARPHCQHPETSYLAVEASGPLREGGRYPDPCHRSLPHLVLPRVLGAARPAIRVAGSLSLVRWERPGSRGQRSLAARPFTATRWPPPAMDLQLVTHS